MRTAEIFPSDAVTALLTYYRLRRIGRDEWLDDQANPTDDRGQATAFTSPIDAVLFAADFLDEPKLWAWEAFVRIAP